MRKGFVENVAEEKLEKLQYLVILKQKLYAEFVPDYAQIM
jgi:hypothetical protein